MDRKGILMGAAAYLMWGFFPAYFKALQTVPAFQIVMHRIVWSAVFLVIVILYRREWRQFRASIHGWKTVGTFILAGMLLAVNWLVYVWGVNAGYVVETSLGYFINPLLSVALGVIFLREKLRPMQWLPIGLAAIAVVYLTIQYGALPWIALTLAFSFGFYGLIKKVSSLGSLYGLTLETGVLFLPAAGFLLIVEAQGNGHLTHDGWTTGLLLAFAGVITALPLLLFASAARRIPLWALGLLQYIAPTCQFLLGVLVYNEPLSTARLVGFSTIWVALLFFSLEGLLVQRRSQALKVTPLA